MTKMFRSSPLLVARLYSLSFLPSFPRLSFPNFLSVHAVIAARGKPECQPDVHPCMGNACISFTISSSRDPPPPNNPTKSAPRGPIHVSVPTLHVLVPETPFSRSSPSGGPPPHFHFNEAHIYLPKCQGEYPPHRDRINKKYEKGIFFFTGMWGGAGPT